MTKCRLAANSTAISRSIISTTTYGAEPCSSGTSSSAASATAPQRFHTGGSGRSGVSIAALPRTAACGLPNRPHGRHTSTTAITANSATSVSLLSGNGVPKRSIEPAPMQNALTIAISTAATKAPGTEPMPPTTTTTKASPISARSRLRFAGSCGICSAPPSAARNVPSANTEVKSHCWLTPSAPTISRSCVAARTSRPQRRARQQQPERAQHQRADDDREQVVGREQLAEDRDRAGHPRRLRAEQVFRAPGPERGVLDHQHQREGREQLVQLGRGIEAAQHQHLDHRAEQRDRERGEQHRAPEAERPGREPAGERDRRVEPEHVERAVREVDDARDAEDQRQAAADQEQRRRRRQAGQDLQQRRRKIHARRRRRRSKPRLADSEAGGAPGGAIAWRPSSQSAGRSFFTSSSLGRYLAPSR